MKISYSFESGQGIPLIILLFAGTPNAVMTGSSIHRF